LQDLAYARLGGAAVREELFDRDVNFREHGLVIDLAREPGL
jgi:hypothetical protein